MTTNKALHAQRGGRVGRVWANAALFLLMYESWVTSMELPELDDISLKQDPDRPPVIPLKEKCTKKESTGMAMISHVRSLLCKRQGLAMYLGDESEDGMLSYDYLVYYS
jgi:hypothetical protein